MMWHARVSLLGRARQGLGRLLGRGFWAAVGGLSAWPGPGVVIASGRPSLDPSGAVSAAAPRRQEPGRWQAMAFGGDATMPSRV